MFNMDSFTISRQLILKLVTGLIVVYTTRKMLQYRKILNSMRRHPGVFTFFELIGFFGNALPKIPFVALGAHWSITQNYNLFREYGRDNISFVTFFPRLQYGYLLADPVTIKEVTMQHTRFPKPIEAYKVLSFFGSNIVITEGAEWKKHRKVAAPTFTDRNNRLVWDETCRVLSELTEGWGTKSEIIVDDVNMIAIPLALKVISSAGFGRQLSWSDDAIVPPGHALSFADAITTVSSDLIIKLVAPNWAYRYFKRLKKIQLAHNELQQYLEEMIVDRRSSSDQAERHDLFSALIESSEKDDEAHRLTDEELIGNIFMFLVAGHETTAHTLTFALGLLALHPEVQETLYQHIKSTVPDGETPTYQLMNSLTYPLAIIYETLRLFPSVPNIPKSTSKDATLPAVGPDGSPTSFVAPAGSYLLICVPALHHNSRYWPHPDTFNPSRFLGDYNKDAFVPFSAAHRSCIGRRFSETETVAVLTLLCRNYKIELKNPSEYQHLTMLEKRQKILRSRPEITTTPMKVPLIFKRRT